MQQAKQGLTEQGCRRRVDAAAAGEVVCAGNASSIEAV